MAGGFRESIVTERIDWAEGLWSIRLDRHLDFEPGQFVNIALDVGAERVRRSYSMASAPGTPVELLLTRVPGGALSTPLFELREGARVFMEDRAFGLLTLEHVPAFAKDLWLLSTGTGLAPFLSMLRSGALLPRFERVIVVNCVRLNAHLAYRAELVRLAAASKGCVRYLPFVTREPPNEGNHSGRITTAIEDGRLERLSGVSFDRGRSHFMLCGNPEMISEAIDKLALRGLKRHRRRDPGHITIEKYW